MRSSGVTEWGTFESVGHKFYTSLFGYLSGTVIGGLHPSCQDMQDYWPSLYLFNLEADSRLLGASPTSPTAKLLPNSATPATPELLQLLYLTNPQWLENGQ